MYKSTFTITAAEAERERLQVRTSELAVLAGRRSFDIRQEDYEKAKREFRNPEAARQSK
jgi:hypothetical protein